MATTKKSSPKKASPKKVSAKKTPTKKASPKKKKIKWSNMEKGRTKRPSSLITYEIEYWGPRKARRALENPKNPKNRNISKEHTDKLSKELRENRFQFNGETVKFNREGGIIDGQHRLAAVATTGIGTYFLTVRNLSDKVFPTVDRNRRRTAAQWLQILGYSNTTNLASAAAWVWRWELKIMHTGEKTAPGPEVTAEVVQRHPDIVRSFQQCRSEAIRRLMSLTMVGALHYLFSKYDSDKADWFFEVIATGLGAKKTHGAYKLREALITDRANRSSGKGSYDKTVIVAMAIKAWNKDRGIPGYSKIAWDPGSEDFPEIQ